MGTFRQILRAAMAALRAATAMMGRIAVAPFKALDDAAELSARILARFFGPAAVAPDEDVHHAIDDDLDAQVLDERRAARELVGSYARRAAQERLEHGVVVSGDIPPTIKAWVSVLPRDALRVLAASDDATVGMHIAGEHTIRDNIGSPMSVPNPEADAVAYRARLAERERREREFDRGFRPMRPAQPMAETSIVPSF